MNRETIEKAAREYAQNKYGGENTKQWAIAQIHAGRDGFIDGALWRINAAWHDMNDKPNGMFAILIDFGDGDGQEEYSLGINLDGVESAKRWAYVSDLLPDAGKENDQ